MLIWKNKVWVSCILLIGIHQITQKIWLWSLPFIDNYLDPFLSIPILLGAILHERRFLIDKYFTNFKASNYHLSILEIIITTTFFAILFEEGFPRWSEHFTKDYWDYLAYFGGGFLFYFFIK